MAFFLKHLRTIRQRRICKAIVVPAACGTHEASLPAAPAHWEHQSRCLRWCSGHGEPGRRPVTWPLIVVSRHLESERRRAS